MIKIKVLNLYAGIGGNRKLWENVDVTAVEINEEIAGVYKSFFPEDKVIVGDAHQYLLDHYSEFDFIWSSPPCPSHSKVRFINKKQNKPIYPDMKLYQEIIFLQNYFKGKYVVENVIPFYEPLLSPQICGRHLFWCNFLISKINLPSEAHSSSIASKIAKLKGINGDFKIKNKVKIIRNCVSSKLGLHILNCALKEPQKKLI